MNLWLRNAALAAGFAAAFAAVPVCVDARADVPVTVRSFAATAPSAYELSASGSTGFSMPAVSFASTSPLLRAVYGVRASSFASSTLLAPNLALDTGRNLDIAARFDNYDGAPSPFLSAVTAPYLGLADGGRYAGFSYAPAANLQMRLGAALNTGWLDSLAIDPFAAGDLPLSYHSSLTKSVLAGLSWDFSDYAGIGVTAISSSRSGVPLGFDTGLADKSSTDAIGVSAHLGFGSGWVTKLAYSEGLSQLDLRSGQTTNEEHSYSIAIAKRGLFGGDDAMGFSFSRPAPSLMGNFASLTESGDLPPMVIAHGETLAPRTLGPQTPETDFQLGYVTNFLDGALALQASAAYQTNYQGQTGATAVSLLSRAKIKF